MRRVARRMGRRSGRPRRETDWIVSAQGLVQDPVPVFGTSQLITLIDGVDLTDHNDQLTVCRIVGELHFWDNEPSVYESDDFTWFGHAGIYKCEVDAANAVIGLEPDDGLDADSEAWLWRHSFISHPHGADTTTTAQLRTFTHGRYSTHIDLRVMRKMGGRVNLVLVFKLFSTGAGSAAGYQALLQLRTLVKLT